MKVVLTPDQKEDKRERDSLLQLSNKIRSDFAFGKIKNVHDLLSSTGYTNEEILKKGYFPCELIQSVTFADIKDYLLDLHCSLEAQLYLKRNPPDLSDLRTPVDIQKQNILSHRN